MPKPFVFDIEFHGEPWNGELLSISGARLGQQPLVSRTLDAFYSLLSDPLVTKVCHTKVDVTWLRQQGIEINGPVHDTQVMAWVINENTPLDLEWLVKRYLGKDMDKRITRQSKVLYFRGDDGQQYKLAEFREWPGAIQWQFMEYNRRDVAATTELYEYLLARMDRSSWDIYFKEEEVPFTQVLIDMELAGLPIDLDAADKLKAEVVDKLQHQEKKLEETLGYRIKWSGRKELQDVLFKQYWFQFVEVPIPPDIDLRKPALVAAIAEAHGIPKSHVDEDAITDLKDSIVRSFLPPGVDLHAITPQKVKGYVTRRGRGLPFTQETDSSKERHKAWLASGKGEEPEPEYSTATPDLLASYEHAADPFVRELLRWRKLQKVITTYLEVYPKRTHEGRLYGRFNQTGTKTGRLSSSGPNLQNQPAHGDLGKAIRSLFRGRLIVGDYGQLEPRLMAHFSGDPILHKAYRENKDVYALTATGIFGGQYEDYPPESERRKQSKRIFLGTQYGARYKKLAALLNIDGFPTTPSQAKAYLAALEETYSVLYAWKEDVVRFARRQGYVETLAGRHRRLSVAFKDKSWKAQGYGERQAVNAEVQGSAGDVVRRCMVAASTDPALEGLRMLAQVHDEVLWEAHPDMTQAEVEAVLPHLKQVMEEAHGFDLSVPLVFEPTIANSWADKGVYDIDWEEGY